MAISTPPGAFLRIDAHRNHGGPYCATGELVRHLVLGDFGLDPGSIKRHRLTLLSVAPDLWDHLPEKSDLAGAFPFFREGFTLRWTLRIAHGIADFLEDAAAIGPVTILIENANYADSLDQECLAVLLRRLDPVRLQLIVCADGAALPPLLADALRQHAEPRTAPVPDDSYVAPEPTADDPDALLEASAYCISMAYYEASLDLARRGLRLLVPAEHGRRYAEFKRNEIFSLLLLGRHAEVEAICLAGLRPDDDPALIMHAAYAMAILYVRLYAPERHDYDAARDWIERALAAAWDQPKSETRAINIAFLRNTMALVEMRKGRRNAAVALLTEALAFLAAEAPAVYDVESTLLLHNRARVHIAERRVEMALEDLAAVLAEEPWNAEVYCSRGLLYQRLGRYDEALRDFDAAIAWSPPFGEAHLNRGEVLSALGRNDAALSDYDRCLLLDPLNLDARLNRACLLHDRGHFDAAAEDVDAGLAVKPDHARLLCLRGLIDLENGELEGAAAAFSRSLDLDPTLADAWANRATVAYRQGHLDLAVADLDRAFALRPDPDIAANRQRVRAALARLSVAQIPITF